MVQRRFPLAPLPPSSPAQTDVGCDDQNYRIAQLGDLIKELIPGVQVIHQGEDVDKRNYRVSFSKTCTERSRSIQKHLGFIPRRTVADGILEIKAAIEDGRIADYRDARYSNYKTLCEACPEQSRRKDNVHLIRQTRLSPLYSDFH